MAYTRDGLEEQLQGDFETFYADDFIEYDGHFDVQTLDIKFSPQVITLSRAGEFLLQVKGESKSFTGTLIEAFHVKKSDYDKIKDQHDTLLAFEVAGRDVGLMNAMENTDYEESDMEDMMEAYADKLNEMIDHYGIVKVVETYELAEKVQDL